MDGHAGYLTRTGAETKHLKSTGAIDASGRGDAGARGSLGLGSRGAVDVRASDLGFGGVDT